MKILLAFGSVILTSLISLTGIFTLPLDIKRLQGILLYLVSFSAGSLLGGAFIHLTPEAVEYLDIIRVSYLILMGIVVFFILEKLIHWRHCHIPTSKHHPHPLGIMNLVGDAIHNFIDGLAIGASYLINISIGISTTVAIIFHEIPQEIADFGVLIHAGFSRKKALLLNFFISLTAVIGMIIAFTIGRSFNLIPYLLPFTAGGFIYIATADLIPELKRDNTLDEFMIQLAAMLFGICIMLLLKFFG